MDLISALDGFDRSADLISALADQIADRLAAKLAVRLMEPSARPSLEASGLWTAQQVAAHYEVGPNFVYRHAEELGAIRLGGGRRPRLRFDPRIVHERWAAVGDALPVAAKTRRHTRRSRSGQRSGAGRTYELLEFEES